MYCYSAQLSRRSFSITVNENLHTHNRGNAGSDVEAATTQDEAKLFWHVWLHATDGDSRAQWLPKNARRRSTLTLVRGTEGKR